MTTTQCDLLPGTVKACESRGFDTTTRLTGETAAKFRASGYSFAVRYISRSKILDGKGMHRDEAELILEAGLALMPVQFGKQKLVATASGGASVGAAAAYNAAGLGFPPGVTVYCDMEDLHADSTTDDAIAYVNAWSVPVRDADYAPGLYVGPGSRLTTAVLYSRLTLTTYWKSAARVGNVDTRGYAMIQGRSEVIHGVHVDPNIAGVDSKGGRPMGLAPM